MTLPPGGVALRAPPRREGGVVRLPINLAWRYWATTCGWTPRAPYGGVRSGFEPVCVVVAWRPGGGAALGPMPFLLGGRTNTHHVSHRYR